MVSRRAFLAGSAGAASLYVAGPAQAQPKLTDDGLYHAAVVSREPARACRRPRQPPPAGQAACHHVGAARLSVCKRHAPDQFRQAGDRRIRQGALRHPSAQHHRRPRGRRLRRREAAGKAAGGEIRRTLTPTFQFFAERSAGLAARKPLEREVVRAQGYLEPERFPGDVPVRRRARLRAGKPVRPPARQRPIIRRAGPFDPPSLRQARYPTFR